jgi:GNAT superfamily N-acetyltransferase
MDIPDLPPDIAFRPLGPDDEGAAFEIKQAALGPHVAARWGWDDAVQTEFHRQRFGARPVMAIVRRGETLGTVCLQHVGDGLRLDEFYLLPQWQRDGLGSRILRHCLSLADAKRLPVRLQHLAWNPVGSLYRRHGFAETRRDDTFIYLRRPLAPVR